MQLTEKQKEKALKLGLKNLSLTNEEDKYLLSFFNTNNKRLQSVYIDKCFYIHEINDFLGINNN